MVRRGREMLCPDAEREARWASKEGRHGRAGKGKKGKQRTGTGQRRVTGHPTDRDRLSLPVPVAFLPFPPPLLLFPPPHLAVVAVVSVVKGASCPALPWGSGAASRHASLAWVSAREPAHTRRETCMSPLLFRFIFACFHRRVSSLSSWGCHVKL